MKRKILLISSVLLTLSLICIIAFSNINNKENNIISNITKEEPVINSNMITMMYETEAGSGEYTETKDNTWPESGYIFNEALSGCENGGELEYNSGNNTVNLLSNSSDRCYVYFDKYDGVWIDNVSITNVTGSSVTLDVSATSENGSITTYYYALNDSEEYIESTTNPIVINDLNKLTEYKISIYAIDSTNTKSNIYEISVSTTDESKPIINSVEVSNITNNGFTLTVNATSDVEIERYYYAIERVDISGTSTGNSYTFNTLNPNTNYDIIIFVLNENGLYSNEYRLNVSTDNTITLSNLVISRYNGIQGNSGIYYHSDSLANSAGDNSYRYSGPNPNNFVCFGSNSSPCPSDNLYRVIGVFDSKVKLIKWDFANSDLLGTDGTYGNLISSSNYGNYKGNHSSVNTYSWTQGGIVYRDWEKSNLNLVNLNENFLNILGTWSNLISTHKWQVAGMPSGIAKDVPALVYNVEVMRNSSGTYYNAKIGLMYLSDYGYAASNNYWITSLYSYRNAISSNWMFMGIDEWTISNSTDADWPSGFLIRNYGNVDESSAHSSYYAIRPCFYLNPDITYVSGSGTESDPIRIQ